MRIVTLEEHFSLPMPGGQSAVGADAIAARQRARRRRECGRQDDRHRRRPDRRHGSQRHNRAGAVEGGSPHQRPARTSSTARRRSRFSRKFNDGFARKDRRAARSLCRLRAPGGEHPGGRGGRTGAHRHRVRLQGRADQRHDPRRVPRRSKVRAAAWRARKSSMCRSISTPACRRPRCARRITRDFRKISISVSPPLPGAGTTRSRCMSCGSRCPAPWTNIRSSISSSAIWARACR